MDCDETRKSKTIKVKTGYGNLYVTVCEEDGQPIQVLATIGKSGQSIMAKAEVTSRLVTLALKYGATIEEIISELRGIAGEQPIPHNNTVILSIPDAVGYALEKLYKTERRIVIND